jgi:hypothetical protein
MRRHRPVADPLLPSTHQAAAVNTTTEAKIKVAINGFGRIGTSRARSRIASKSSETS